MDLLQVYFFNISLNMLEELYYILLPLATNLVEFTLELGVFGLSLVCLKYGC